MLKFIIKRICASIPTMLVLITVSFFLMRLAPGSPFTGERNLPPAVMANIEAKYHLNDPMYLQYFHYLKQLAQGDLGPSFKYKDFSVNELLAQSLPVSAELGFYAFLIAAIFGMFIGIIAALKQNSWLDYALMSGAMTGIVVPSFVMAPVLVLVGVCRQTAMAACRRLERWRTDESDFARCYFVHRLCVQYCADYARRDDRSIEQPLYPHSTRQRPAHEPHHPAPCAASRHAADCFFLRSGIRRHHYRLHCD